MMESTPTQALVDLAPALRLALLAALLALVPLAWVWLRRRGDGVTTSTRLATLTALTLFLTFDLVVFGAFTRLTDSGLGCPDWPGCYGQASPLGAASEISAAESAAPSGKVTWHKAWIEMIHRYLAMTVGVLILVMAAVSWRERFSARKTGLPFSPWWPTATLAWVVVQGLFGKYTVTLKLYPAVVTLHLLGGLALVALLAVQHAAFTRRALALAPRLRTAAAVAFAVLGVQIALGGWVSTNVAVLACTGFPQCNGQWWPEMSGAGFVLLRELGHAADGSGLPYEAMIAIHMAHRVFAVVAALVLAALAWVLWRVGGEVGRFGAALAAVLVVQMASGLSNVVLGWPLIAALAHSAGAAALVLLLALLLARSARAPRLASQPASLGPLAA
ncbi:MAG TPA: COX15/CtaA family protein [Rubrivivax sp.]|nr:COX15/CtaA family protein [Rubrivivax sp.]